MIIYYTGPIHDRFFRSLFITVKSYKIWLSDISDLHDLVEASFVKAIISTSGD